VRNKKKVAEQRLRTSRAVLQLSISVLDPDRILQTTKQIAELRLRTFKIGLPLRLKVIFSENFYEEAPVLILSLKSYCVLSYLKKLRQCHATFASLNLQTAEKLISEFWIYSGGLKFLLNVEDLKWTAEKSAIAVLQICSCGNYEVLLCCLV
jgi:cellulose synthase/poly-beta-1,6-N-acetylglucosamine synthase-like glycosyltransferase